MICRHFKKCGGCRFQDIPYKEELKLKRSFIESLFNTEVNKVIPSPKEYFYRNKMDFVVHRGRLGLRERGKWWKAINLEECKIFSERVGEYLRTIKENIDLKTLSYDLFKKKGFLRYVVFREGKFIDNIMTIFVTTSERELDFSIFLDHFDSVVWEINDSPSDVSYGKIEKTFGKEFWEEKFFKYKFKFLPNAFAQTNSYAAQELYRLANDIVEGGNTLLDAYAGVGTFGIILSEKFDKVIGIEESDQSIKSFEMNINELEIENYEMFRGRVEDLIKRFDFDVLLLDPPRSGLHPKVIKIINEKKPKEIIYISCNPKTQKRDIDLLKDYEVEFIQPIDMFPRTEHVENIVKLVRKNG